MKTAHIFLAAASLATLTALAGCGTNNSNELSSPGYNVNELVTVPSVVSLAITPQVASGHVGQAVQLQVTATLSNGQQADITQFVNWTSSDPELATVSGTGVVNARMPGTVTITATSGSATSSIQFTVNPFITRIFTSNKTTNSIQVFDLNATGSVNPVHTISGAATRLNQPGQMVAVGQELFVANTGGGEVDVYYLQAEGNVAPLRRIKATGVAAPTGIAINTTTNELFVLSGTTIAVFNTSDNGETLTPKRIITGAATTLASTENAQIALTNAASSFPNAILVPNSLNVLAFPQNGNGDVAPTKTLTGPAALLKKATAVAVNTATDSIFVSDPSATVPSVYRWPVTANTTDAPAFTLTDLGQIVNPLGLLPVTSNGSLWVVDNSNRVSLYPAAGAPATRSFVSSALSSPSGIVIQPSF